MEDLKNLIDYINVALMVKNEGKVVLDRERVVEIRVALKDLSVILKEYEVKHCLNKET